jgi:hypothetical protein
MSRRFKEGGVSFSYPENWRLEREESETGWTVSLQSPQTAFVIVACDGSMPTAEDVAQTTLEALQSEYPGLEADAAVDTLAGQMAVGHDIRFFSFDLTNTCWTRSLYSDSGTLLVMCQANDLELEDYEPVMRAICSSLQVEQD